MCTQTQHSSLPSLLYCTALTCTTFGGRCSDSRLLVRRMMKLLTSALSSAERSSPRDTQLSVASGSRAAAGERGVSDYVTFLFASGLAVGERTRKLTASTKLGEFLLYLLFLLEQL